MRLIFCEGKKLDVSIKALLLMLLVVGAHPYLGIIHDGKLYLAQALLHKQPDIYGLDLFFKYGSQDAFTIFPHIYAWGIELMGVNLAHAVFLFFCNCIFFFGVWLLGAVVLGRELSFWSCCAVALVSHYYGGFGLISYEESFFTARSLAEPLCLLAFAFLLVGYTWFSLGVFFFALTLHPLMVIPCLFVWWVYCVFERRAFLYAFIFLPIIFLLNYLNVAPFDLIQRTYDDEWWRLVCTRNKFVIPSQWMWMDWARVLLDFCLIGSAYFFSSNNAKRFFLSVVAGAATLLTLSFLGTSGLRNVLLTSLQLWRVDWVLHLTAVMALPLIVRVLWAENEASRLATFLFVLALVFYPEPSAIYFFLFSGALFWFGRQEKEWSQLLRILLVGCITGAFVLYFINVMYQSLMIGEGEYYIFGSESRIDDLKNLLYFGELRKLLFLVFLASYFFYTSRWLLMVFSGVWLTLLLCFFDQRSLIQKFISSSESEGVLPFVKKKMTGEVYWQDEVLMPWVVLRAPSFFSGNQGSGLLFNRGTAMEFKRRADLLYSETKFCKKNSTFEKNDGCMPTLDLMQRVCRQYNNLELIVLPKSVDVKNEEKWVMVVPGAALKANYYIYRCASLR